MQDGVQMLDTREPAAFAAAHLEGSINIGLIGQYATWAGTVLSRERDDLRPGLHMATSGRHCVFFEADRSRILVVRVLHR